MKKLLLIAASFVIGATAMAQQKVDDVIKVKTEKIDFGKIKQNVPVTTYFEIKNISNKPVVIESATGSCGCTTPEVPKEPIAPNATIKLKVNYNAAALNQFNKDVFVKVAGIQEPKNLKITGEVLEPAAFATYAKQKKTTVAKKAKS
ncbi:MAG TPA: DUF1573 domain-containing protein [Chitinophagaceae bacterium]|nr:DUF1573 domain-containing protein [Chitinophagaceae bacterium]